MEDLATMPVLVCRQCQMIGFPPLYVCRKCGSSDFHESKITGEGEIYTHTTIRVAPEAYRDEAPYDIAIVELNPELRITARIITEVPGSIHIGDKVKFQRVDGRGYWFHLIS